MADGEFRCPRCATCRFDPVKWGGMVQCIEQLEKDRDRVLNELDEQSKCMAKIKIGHAVDRLKVSFITAVLIVVLTQVLPWALKGFKIGG